MFFGYLYWLCFFFFMLNFLPFHHCSFFFQYLYFPTILVLSISFPDSLRKLFNYRVPKLFLYVLYTYLPIWHSKINQYFYSWVVSMRHFSRLLNSLKTSMKWKGFKTSDWLLWGLKNHDMEFVCCLSADTKWLNFKLTRAWFFFYQLWAGKS